MLNTKVYMAVLSVIACASARTYDGTTTQVHEKRRALRRARVVSAATINDLTEDVAFWTRSLQASFPQVPPDVESPIPSPTVSDGAITGPPVIASSPIPSPTGTGGVTTGPPITASSPIPSPTSTGSFSSLPPVASPIPSPIGTGGAGASGPPVGVPGTFAPSSAETAPKASNPPAASNLPVAQDDSETINAADGVSFIDVLVNDISSTGQTLTVKSITQNASNGDCSIGLDLLTVVYVPNEGFTGTDSCEYEACDLVPNCVTATVTITVN